MFTALTILACLFMAQIFFPQFKLSFKNIAFLTLGLTLVFSFDSFAQVVAEDPTKAPEWLAGVLVWIASIPKVGPVVVEIFKWIGVLASVFTALSVALSVISKIPEIALRFAKLPELADKVSKFNDKIQPYIKYLSIFNHKK